MARTATFGKASPAKNNLSGKEKLTVKRLGYVIPNGTKKRREKERKKRFRKNENA